MFSIVFYTLFTVQCLILVLYVIVSWATVCTDCSCYLCHIYVQTCMCFAKDDVGDDDML